MSSGNLHLGSIPVHIPSVENPLTLTQAKLTGEAYETLRKAGEDISQLQRIQSTVEQNEIMDQQSLQMAEVALETVMAPYKLQDVSLEALGTTPVQGPSTRERVLERIKRVIKALLDFTISLLKRLMKYGEELIRTSETRRNLLRSRIKGMQASLKKNPNELTLLPLAIKPEQVALIANGVKVENSYKEFMDRMSESIKSFLNSPNLRLVREVYGIYSTIEDEKDKDRFIFQRLEKLRTYQWVKQQPGIKNYSTKQAYTLPGGKSVSVTHLPNNKLLIFNELGPVTQTSTENLGLMGYMIREREYEQTLLERQYFDLTDPSAFSEELSSLESLLSNLGDLIHHIRQEQPELEKARRQLDRLVLMIDAHVPISERMAINMRVFNAAVNNLVSFPTQLFHELINFTSAYTSLLSAVSRYR